MKTSTMRRILSPLMLGILLSTHNLHAMGTSFPYQGALVDGGVPATGAYAMEFRLFDAATDGNMIGIPVTLPSVPVTNGIFQTPLDFGPAPFNGEERWLEVVVNGTPLSPRTSLSPVPYAMRAASASSVTWGGIAGVPAALADGDDVNDADADPANEQNTSLSLSGTTLQLSDSGGILSADLSIFDQRLMQTIIVSPGESIQTAINSITDASATKPYLVKVEPGVYAEKVTLKDYVDLEGSGQDRTIITATGGTISPNTNASSVTLEIPSNSEVRFLTVESISTVAYSSAVRASLGNPTLHKVTLKSNGGTFANYPLVVRSGATVSDCSISTTGVFARGAYHSGTGTLTVRNTPIMVSSAGTNGYGAESTSVAGPLVLESCSISLSGSDTPVGVAAAGTTLRATNCDVYSSGASATGVRYSGTGSAAIRGGSVRTDGTLTLAFGVNISSGIGEVAGCPVTTTARTVATGIQNSGSEIRVMDSKIDSSGEGAHGIRNLSTATLTIHDCNVTSSGSITTTYGVRDSGLGTIDIEGTNLNASATTENATGFSSGGPLVTAANCIIKSSGVVASGVNYGGTGTCTVRGSSIEVTSSGANSYGAQAGQGTLQIINSSATAGGSPNNNYAVWVGNNVSLNVEGCSLLTTGPGGGGGTLRTEFGGTVKLNVRSSQIENTAVNGGALSLVSPQAVVTDTLLKGAYGVGLNAGTLELRNCDVAGSTNAILMFGGTVKVAASRVDGPITGTPTCFSVYDENYAALGANCQ